MCHNNHHIPVKMLMTKGTCKLICLNSVLNFNKLITEKKSVSLSE